MKQFLIKTLFFIFGLLILYLTYYITADFFINSKTSNNSLFIWGDSQAFQGIDLKILKHTTNKDVYTAARHGAGVYDFLVFVEKVPSNSDVLVAISKPVQLRSKTMDRNRCVISINALKFLIKNNYTYKEIFAIIKKNFRKPEKIFLSNTQMFEYADSIVLSEPIEFFENFYKETPDYIVDKQNLILKGIEILNRKNCNINFIQFPYHPLLKEIEENSSVKEKTDSFFNKIISITDIKSIDTLKLADNKQFMYDLTHLNCLGAEQVSIFLAERLRIKDRTKVYVIHTGNNSYFKDPVSN